MHQQDTAHRSRKLTRMTAFVEVAVPFVVFGLPGTDSEAMIQ